MRRCRGAANCDASRFIHAVPMRSPCELIDQEPKDDPTVRERLEDSIAQDEWPRAYRCRPSVVSAEP
eukprot:337240-Alexandrium_andersonii.AAC.1